MYDLDNHPLNKNNREILRRFITTNAKDSIDEEEIEKRINALYDFLSDHTNITYYDEDASLDFNDNRLKYWQWGTEEYYHDGSIEPRKYIEFILTSKEVYEKEALAAKEEDKKPYDFCINEKWMSNDKSEEHFCSWFCTDVYRKRFCFFAKSFLNLFEYVIINGYTWL